MVESDALYGFSFLKFTENCFVTWHVIRPGESSMCTGMYSAAFGWNGVCVYVSPREENGSPLQYSCLDNSTDRGAWWDTVYRSQRAKHDSVTNTSTYTEIRVEKHGTEDGEY